MNAPQRPNVQSEETVHPVLQVATAAIRRNPEGDSTLTEAGRKNIIRALELSAGDDTIVPALTQLMAFAGHLDLVWKETALAEEILGIAAPWGPVIRTMTENFMDPTGSKEAVHRVRRLAENLDKRQVVKAPMWGEKAPRGTVQHKNLYRPRTLRC